MDLVPPVPTTRPPRFRAARDLPRWEPLSEREIMAWREDMRGLADVVDDEPRDPWEPR